MKRQKPKRNKAYRPKYIHVPVMPELHTMFLTSMHGALAALRLAPNLDAFDQLGGVLNVIAIAITDKGRKSIILESGIRALESVCERINRTGAIAIGQFELPPIENAVFECEQLVHELDIIALHVARVKLSAIQQQMRAAA